jgi:lipooligosaccharide transport system ATP-binding protein
LLLQLASEGTALFITTHYMEEAERLCDRLVIMDQGKILTEGTPQALIAEHVGAPIEQEGRLRPAGLEDVFLRLAGRGLDA